MNLVEPSVLWRCLKKCKKEMQILGTLFGEVIPFHISVYYKKKKRRNQKKTSNFSSFFSSFTGLRSLIFALKKARGKL